MIKSNLLNPRLAEIGKIKIGGKGDERTSKTGTKYRLPVKYDEFVITTTERDKKTGQFIKDIELMKKIARDDGPQGTKKIDIKLKEIPIQLVFDDIDINFYTSFSSYIGRKAFCKGDGETAERESKSIKCDPGTCKLFESDKCKVSGILSCMIRSNPEFGGVYRFRTHSWNSVSNILASLKFISDNTNGVLQGLPLKLKMLKKTTEEHGDVNIVTIVLDGIEMQEMRNTARIEHQNRLQLKIDMKSIETRAKQAGFLNDTDDPGDVQDEYYVDTIDNESISDTEPEPSSYDGIHHKNVNTSATSDVHKPTPPSVRVIKENKCNPEELKEAIEEKQEDEKEEKEPEKKNQNELDIF